MMIWDKGRSSGTGSLDKSSLYVSGAELHTATPKEATEVLVVDLNKQTIQARLDTDPRSVRTWTFTEYLKTRKKVGFADGFYVVEERPDRLFEMCVVRKTEEAANIKLYAPSVAEARKAMWDKHISGELCFTGDYEDGGTTFSMDGRVAASDNGCDW
jgi:hypothetical protein